jgi:hypothetical protein
MIGIFKVKPGCLGLLIRMLSKSSRSMYFSSHHYRHLCNMEYVPTQDPFCKEYSKSQVLHKLKSVEQSTQC